MDLIDKRFGKLVVVSIGNKKHHLICQCDCGNKKEIYKSSLILGKSKSCGCINSPDLTGKRFYKLVVIGLDKIEKTVKIWKCICDCGNIVCMSSGRLNRTKSCGCFLRNDLLGKKFNSLTIIKYDNTIDNRAYWICKCDCGKEKSMCGSNVLYGKSKTCGCGKSKISDLSNLKFGRLYILGFSHMFNNMAYWFCKCDCGKEKTLPGTRLVKGEIKSCGCSRRDYSIVGKQFGKLIVLDFAYKRGRDGFWLCQCECGNKKAIARTHLKSGATKSCGCDKSISQTLLTRVVEEIFPLPQYNIRTNYLLPQLYNKKTKANQQLDIVVFEHNTIKLAIEYDGKQHFMPVNFGSGEEKAIKGFKRQKYLDRRKNKIMNKNNIPLIRFSYLDKIDKDTVMLAINNFDKG